MNPSIREAGGPRNPRSRSLLLEICEYPELLRQLVRYLDLDSLLHVELVCRDLRRAVVEGRIYRDRVSAGIR